MTKLLLILLVGLVFEAIGVVCLSKGLKEIGELNSFTASEIFRLIKAGFTNRNMVLGVFFEAIFFVALLTLMSKGSVSFVWPLTSLSFVMTTLAAKFVLHEEVSTMRWMGVLLIMLGAGVITYTEKAEGKRVVDELSKPPSQSSSN
jgi:uncharacterized membrane protein